MNSKTILPFSAAFACALFFSACEGDNVVNVTEQLLGNANNTNQTDITPQGNSENKGSTENLLIDNFEDGDGKCALGESWYFGTDAGSGAESTIEPVAKGADGQPTPSKTDNGSKNALSFKYTLKKGKYQYDAYVNWGVHLPKSIDFSKYTGISYRYKGGFHSIRLETSDVKDSDFHVKQMNSSKEWKSVTVEFSKLTQEGWGAPAEFDAAHLTGISIQVKGPDGQDSLSIDDIYLIGSN